MTDDSELLLHGRKHGLVSRVQALRVAETRGAGANAAGAAGVLACAARTVRIGNDVVNDVVGMVQIAGNSTNSQEMIEPQVVANAPGNVMVGARSISADSDAADAPLLVVLAF